LSLNTVNSPKVSIRQARSWIRINPLLFPYPILTVKLLRSVNLEFPTLEFYRYQVNLPGSSYSVIEPLARLIFLEPLFKRKEPRTRYYP